MSKRIDYRKLEKMYDPTLSDRLNAYNIGVSLSTFTKWRNSKGYPPNGTFGEHAEKIDYEKFKRLYDLGKSDKEIAETLGFKAMSIYTYRRRHHIPTNHPRIRVSMEELETEILPTLPDSEKPWHDPDSLFCDKDFLEKFKAGDFKM